MELVPRAVQDTKAFWKRLETESRPFSQDLPMVKEVSSFLMLGAEGVVREQVVGTARSPSAGLRC